MEGDSSHPRRGAGRPVGPRDMRVGVGHSDAGGGPGTSQVRRGLPQDLGGECCVAPVTTRRAPRCTTSVITDSLPAPPSPCLSLTLPGCLTLPPSPLQRWAFLARFCFLSQDGTFSFEVKYDMKYATQRLLLYYDTQDQWPAVYGSTKVGGRRASRRVCDGGWLNEKE